MPSLLKGGEVELNCTAVVPCLSLSNSTLLGSGEAQIGHTVVPALFLPSLHGETAGSPISLNIYEQCRKPWAYLFGKTVIHRDGTTLNILL